MCPITRIFFPFFFSFQMGMAALHWAVTYEHWDVVSLLMDNGANANLLDMYGRTPLFITDANISILSQVLTSVQVFLLLR
jgi:FOG: Ankyrin repeat